MALLNSIQIKDLRVPEQMVRDSVRRIPRADVEKQTGSLDGNRVGNRYIGA